MATATVTIKVTPTELHTIDEALRLFVYVGFSPPLVVLGRPFDHYTWDMDLDEISGRAAHAEQIRADISL